MYTNVERFVDIQIVLGFTFALITAWVLINLSQMRQRRNCREAVRRANERALRRATGR